MATDVQALKHPRPSWLKHFARWRLGAGGVGRVAFALYSFAEAVWRRINVEAV